MSDLRYLIFGLMILGLFSGTETEGADWKFLKTNRQGDFFYDSENITHSSNNTVGVWLKIVYSREFKKEEGLDDLSHTLGLWEINCTDKEICLLSTSHCSGEGEISPPQVWLPPEWKPIVPDTVMDDLHKEFCR